jgi:hypothetical protein
MLEDSKVPLLPSKHWDDPYDCTILKTRYLSTISWIEENILMYMPESDTIPTKEKDMR